MKNFEEFVARNRKALYALAEKTTPTDEYGHVVLLPGDPWRDEDEWDEYYKELEAREKNPSA